MTSVWGPSTWYLMHIISLTFRPKVNNKIYINFYKSFSRIIPCNKCKKHYKSHISRKGYTPEQNCNKKKIVKWVFIMHNRVNGFLKKPMFKYGNFKKVYYKKGKLNIHHPKMRNAIKVLVKYNTKNKRFLRVFIINLCHIYPCERCRLKLIKALKVKPITVKNIYAWLKKYFYPITAHLK